MDKEIKQEFEKMNDSIERLSMLVVDGFKNVDQRFAQVDQRFAQVDQRFAQVDRRFQNIAGQMRDLQSKLTQTNDRISMLDNRLTGREDYHIEEVGALKKRMDIVEDALKIPHPQPSEA